MPVLHVEDGIVVVALLRQADIEVERHVAPAEQEEHPGGVGTRDLEQLAQGDEIRRPLAHPVRLAVLGQVHQLEDDHLQIAPQGRDRRLHPLHVTGMVRAPDVDQAAVPARDLVEVVGDVRGEIGGLAVGLEQRTVPVVAEPGGLHHLERLGNVLLLLDVHPLRRREHLHGRHALLVQHLDGPLKAPLVVEDLFAEEVVEADSERLQIRLDQVLQDPGGGELSQRLADLLERPRRIAARIQPGAGHVLDILALVVVRVERHRPHVLAQLGGAGQDGVGQAPDLPAGVVDVELAEDVVARPLQEIGDHVADRRAPTMADVHRPGGVGTDELHHRAQPIAGVAAAEAIPVLPDRVQRLVPHVLGQLQIQEAGSGDLRLSGEHAPSIVDALHDRLCQRARIGFLGPGGCGVLPGERHRRVRCEVAMRRLLRHVELDRVVPRWQESVVHAPLQCAPHELGDLLLHHAGPFEYSRSNDGRSRSQLACKCSIMTFVSPRTGMKLVSPFHRGTTCQWTCSAIPAPAARPRFIPTLWPCAR